MVTSPEPKRSAASATAFCSVLGQLAVAGDNADIEPVGIPLVLQAAKPLDPLDLLGRQFPGGLDADLVEGHAALQHTGVGIAEGLEAGLEEVAPPCPWPQTSSSLSSLAKPSAAVYRGEVDPRGAGDGRGRLDVENPVAFGRPGGVLGGVKVSNLPSSLFSRIMRPGRRGG